MIKIATCPVCSLVFTMKVNSKHKLTQKTICSEICKEKSKILTKERTTKTFYCLFCLKSYQRNYKKKSIFCSRLCSASYKAAKNGNLVTTDDTSKKDLLSRKNRSKICSHAKTKLKKPKQCFLCSFSSILQLCHIKPVKHFSDSETLKIINDPNNLIYLCPNHHQLLDKNLLYPNEIEQIKNRNLNGN